MGRGIYRLSTAPPLTSPDLVSVAIRMPRSVICLISALAHHGLKALKYHGWGSRRSQRLPQSCATILAMKVAYIRWKDAVAEEAADGPPRPSQAKLVDLQEIGFLLDENDEAVEIGMELSEDAEVRPGRWRLHIPRVSIQEMRILDLDRLLPKRRRKAAATGD